MKATIKYKGGRDSALEMELTTLGGTFGAKCADGATTTEDEPGVRKMLFDGLAEQKLADAFETQAAALVNAKGRSVEA